MQMTVTDENGLVVAEVQVDPTHPFHRAVDGSVAAHVIGQFVPGEGFPRIRKMLDAFHEVYKTGDMKAAFAVHEEIDQLGMSAMDSEGTRYHVFNVHFQQGALLFAAAAPSASKALPAKSSA